METSSQAPQPQRPQTQEELDLEIIDLPDRSEGASTRHAWLWHTILHVQHAINLRSWRLIQICFTLLLVLIATLLILSSIIHPLASSPVITPEHNELVASSNPIDYDRNPLTVYRGHTGPVRSVAWSPNGELLAASGQDATVQLWDSQTGKLLLIYRGHSSTVTNIAWSPDSTRIASVSLDATAQVWDARTGKLLFIYEGHSGFVTSLAWSPNGAFIASGGRDGTIQVWNAFLGQNIITFLSQANSVAWSPRGSFVTTGGTDGLVKLWPIARPTHGGHTVH